MSDPSERDEPSFVTNIERSLDPRVPSPLGSAAIPSFEDEEEVEATEVGTLPGPQLQRLHDDADEPVENTAILPLPDARVSQLPPMRPRLDSEAAGFWQAPDPNGAPLPISSDTEALHRSELPQPPPLVFGATMPLAVTPLSGAVPAFPSVPLPMFSPVQAPAPRAPSAPAFPPPPRRRRGSAIYFVWFLVVGVIVGAGVALKLGIVRRGKSTTTTIATVTASASTPSAAPPPSAIPSALPIASTPAPSASEASEATSPAPTAEPSAAPVGSGRHGRPRRPRRGK